LLQEILQPTDFSSRAAIAFNFSAIRKSSVTLLPLCGIENYRSPADGNTSPQRRLPMTPFQVLNLLKRQRPSRIARKRIASPRRRIMLKAERLEDRYLPAMTFAVMNTNPTGPGSFEQAILDSNGTAGPNEIVFNIGHGVQVIQPNDPGLDPITNPVLIDGSTVPGQLIELDGTVVINADASGTPNPIGLFIKADNCTVRGLSIVNFQKADPRALGAPEGIGIQVEGADNIISGNLIGTDYHSLPGLGNVDGIVIRGADRTVHDNAVLNNTIVSSYYDGINVLFADNNWVQDNNIGTDSQRDHGLGNGVGINLVQANSNIIDHNLVVNSTFNPGAKFFTGDGIDIGLSNKTTISSNVVSENGTGIDLVLGATNSIIVGNRVGVADDGVTPMGNGQDGIRIDVGGQGNMIGMPDEPPNVISGNGDDGVTIEDSAGGGFTMDNQVLNNYIGVGADGVTAVPNSYDGVRIERGAHNNVIGLGANTINVISGNRRYGIAILGSDTFANTVSNDYIGVDIGLHPQPNGSDGVHIAQGASSNAIGQFHSGTLGNTIAYNHGNGITVGEGPGDSATFSNTILSNSIFGNTALGIDLGDDGVTPNTPGGPHVGPNDFQNYPVITEAGSSNGITDIYATINTSPSSLVDVQFFSNPPLDPAAHAQGLSLLGTKPVITDSNGNGFAALVVPIDLTGLFITATATQDNVLDTPTSEFSASVQVGNLPPTIGGFSPAVIAVLSRPIPIDVTINGHGFVGASPSGTPGSTAYVNGMPVPTQFVNDSEIIAIVPSSMVARPGQLAVTVVNPGPFTSAPMNLPVMKAPFTLVLNGDQVFPGQDDHLTLDVTDSGFTEVTLNGQVSLFAPGVLNGIIAILGGGVNTVDVHGTARGVPFDFHGDGHDTVNIGNGDARSIKGTVTIDDSMGSAAITVDDSLDPTRENVTLNSACPSDDPFLRCGVITGITPAAIMYRHAGTTSVTVNPSHADGNWINVLATGEPTNVQLSGTATVDVGQRAVDLIGLLTIGNTKAAGTNLIVDDSVDPANWDYGQSTLPSVGDSSARGSIVFSAPTSSTTMTVIYDYAGTQSATLLTSNTNGDRVDIFSTGVPTNVQLSGTATVDVGDGNVELLGVVTVTNKKANATQLIVDDSRDPGLWYHTLRSLESQRAMGSIVISAPTTSFTMTVNYDYAGTQSVSLLSSNTDGDEFKIFSTGVPTSVQASGEATVDVGKGIVDLIGPLNVSNRKAAATNLIVDNSRSAGTGPCGVMTSSNGIGSVTFTDPLNMIPVRAINYDYAGTKSVRIMTSNADGDQINIFATGVPTTVQASGRATVDVGEGTVELFGAVTVTNTKAKATTLIVDDSQEGTYWNYKMSSAPGSNAMGSIVISRPTTSFTMTVDYDYASTQSLTLLTSNTDMDMVNIFATGVPTSIRANGLATVDVGEGVVDLIGPLNISNKKANATTLIVDDTLNRVVWNWNVYAGSTIAFDPVTMLPVMVVNWDDATTKSASFLTTTYGPTSYNILATAVPTTLIARNALFATLGDGSTQGIRAPLSFVNSSTGADTLTINDSKDPVGRTVTVTDSMIAGLTPAPVSFTGGPHWSTTVLEGGSGGNAFDVVSWAGPITLNTGSGNDTVNLGPQPLANIVGPVTVHGQGGVDTLILDNSASPTAVTYVLRPNAIVCPSDDYIVNYDGVAAITIAAGSAMNTLVGPDVPNTWHVTGPNSGQVGIVSFSGMANLIGGAAADTFAVSGTGGVTGAIDGGTGGENIMDYSGYRADILVDLPLGLATAVNGGIRNIRDVIGSQGNSLLIGDANGNRLVGGAGRNVIIGGAGADQIFGGNGDNLLLSGSTAYDMNLVALQVIMREWTRTDADFSTRLAHLRTGGGLNGDFLLDATHVFGDGVQNAVTGGSGQNAFFVQPSDVIRKVQPGDLIIFI
jgi:hypothetical protein